MGSPDSSLQGEPENREKDEWKSCHTHTFWLSGGDVSVVAKINDEKLRTLSCLEVFDPFLCLPLSVSKSPVC